MKVKSTNTILYCKKWQETVEFYRTGLKLLVLSSNEWFVEFKLNEMSQVSVANEARTSIKSSDGKGITISLQVADVEQTHHELIEAGFIPTPIKDVWGVKAIYVRDPEGNRLEFWSGRARKGKGLTFATMMLKKSIYQVHVRQTTKICPML